VVEINPVALDTVLRLGQWPATEGYDLEFTLVYEGDLYSNGDAKHKHEIRKQLHPQLKELWKLKLPHYLTMAVSSGMSRKVYAGPPTVEAIATNFTRNGYRFVPLVMEQWNLACALDILFLRKDEKQGVVHGGDIDNRLKTLFDGLRMPSSAAELGGYTPSSDEDPFYCLLEDDKLITELHVTTDTLLAPVSPAGVKLIIRVRLRPFRLSELNTDFA